MSIYSRLYQLAWRTQTGSDERAIFRKRRELERTQWLSPAEIQALQLEKLSRLLTHAYANVPFYRQRFDDIGLHPDQIQTLEDYQRVPILTKDDIRQNLEQLVVTDCQRNALRRNTTGGSTGVPLVFYQDREFTTSNWASRMRYRKWYGFEMGDKVAFLWGMDRDIPSSDWLKRLKVSLRRERWLNSFNVSKEKMEAFARRLIAWQPTYIVAYASSAYLFASFLRQAGLDRIRPVAIESSAEKLWDFQRELIEDVFQCPVFNVYGSREFGGLAAECEAHAGLHILADVRYLEFLREGQPVQNGGFGEIIVTDLTNYAMPFIRYQTGDLGRPQPQSQLCACGRGFPLVQEIVGRSSDVLPTPDGRYVHGEYFTHLFYGVPGVRRFQVHQKTLHDVDVLIELIEGGRELPAETLAEIRRKILAQMGERTTVTFKMVDVVPLTPSGKYRFTISDVPIDFVKAPPARVEPAENGWP
jgi:phenylacetate-CoA ligase